MLKRPQPFFSTPLNQGRVLPGVEAPSYLGLPGLLGLVGLLGVVSWLELLLLPEVPPGVSPAPVAAPPLLSPK